MKWLSENKKVVPLKEIAISNTVAITFDDSFKNVHDVALPILKKYKLPATFFITTGLVENDKLFWVDRLEHMINFSEKPMVELDIDINRKFTLSGIQDKLFCLNVIKSFLKNANPAKREEILGKIELQTGFNEKILPKNYETLTWGDVKNLDNPPNYEVGGHTVNHEILSYLNEKQLKDEIQTCVQTLSKRLRRKNIDSFSYPEGQKNHYNDKVISVLKENGIKICPSAVDGIVDGTDDNFNLKRIMVGFQDRKFPFKEYYSD
jgi:peptidoglycan/xylan/chitin deacetylase (PgdA/CDA1 family)